VSKNQNVTLNINPKNLKRIKKSDLERTWKLNGSGVIWGNILISASRGSMNLDHNGLYLSNHLKTGSPEYDVGGAIMFAFTLL
jgi:hypothetical protein